MFLVPGFLCFLATQGPGFKASPISPRQPLPGSAQCSEHLCFGLQGARGFPGTPGLPGVKGHRVSIMGGECWKEKD